MQKKKTNPAVLHSKKRVLPKWTLWVSITLVIVVAVAAYFFLLRPRLLTQTQPTPTFQSVVPAEITVADALILLQRGAYFLDVRTTGEWETFHIENSVSIPLDELSARLDEIPTDILIVVVCRTGNRSQQGREILLQAGFPSVTNMGGGMEEWVLNGYPFIGIAPY